MAEKHDRTIAELSAISNRLRQQSVKLSKQAKALTAEIERIKKLPKKRP